MAFTESNMMALGTSAPAFILPEPKTGNQVSLSEVSGEKGTVVLFLCNHCPYVIYVNHILVAIARAYMSQGIGFVAINSNDVNNYPEDAPDKMSIVAKVLQYPFPYLYDETQEVAKAYDAACTPDIYVFDQHQKLYYRGRIDDSKPNSGKPQTGQDLKHALDGLLSNQPMPEKQYPSGGCNIKWKNNSDLKK